MKICRALWVMVRYQTTLRLPEWVITLNQLHIMIIIKGQHLLQEVKSKHVE